MKKDRIGRLFLIGALFAILVSSCSSGSIQISDTQPSEKINSTATPANPTPTLTALPTKTSAPTATPTTPPPEPALLNSENIQDIQLISSTEFFKRGILSDAEWSPDGKTLIVTTSKDLEIVDANTLEILDSIEGYEFVQFQQNGDLLLRDEQGLPVFFDMQSYEIKPINAEFPKNEWRTAVIPFAISSDGKMVVDVSTENKIKITDITTGEMTEFDYYFDDYATIEAFAVAISPDDNYIFVSSHVTYELNQVLVFDLERKQLVSKQSGISGIPLFSQDNKRLVYRTKNYISVFTSILGPWFDLPAFFSTELNADENVFYNAQTYSFVQDSSQLGILYQGSIYNFAENSERSTATIIIYNTNSGETVHFINDIPASSLDMGFNPDGSRFFTLSEEGYIQIWQTSNGELLLTSDAYKPYTSIAISPDGKLFAYTQGNVIKIVNIADGKIINEFTNPKPAHGVSVTFQGNDIIAISTFGQIDTYDVMTGEWIRNYPELSFCGFNRTGTTMICSGGDLKLFDADTGRTLIQIRPSGSNQFAVSDDGAYTAYCNFGSETVYLYDTQKGEQIKFLKMNNYQPACGVLDFSSDSQFLVSSLGAVWQIPDGDLLLEIDVVRPDTPNVSRSIVEIAPDDEFVLIDSNFYDLSDGSLLAEINAGDEPIYTAWFQPDGFNLILMKEGSLEFWGVLE